MRAGRHWILRAQEWAESDWPVVVAGIIAAIAMVVLYLTNSL